MKKSFKARNIQCGGCANTIKTALLEEFGEVFVDLQKEPRVVTLKIENAQEEEKFRKKMRDLGYPIEDEEMGSFTKGKLKAKSFISCAIGKMQKE